MNDRTVNLVGAWLIFIFVGFAVIIGAIRICEWVNPWVLLVVLAGCLGMAFWGGKGRR